MEKTSSNTLIQVFLEIKNKITISVGVQKMLQQKNI